MKNKSPLVSVIIVNYNGKHYLKSCLDSLLKQSLAKSKYEIIVVDNDSDDNSVSFLKKNYPQIRLVQSKENVGFAGGNNLGAKHSSAKYIALINNDTKADKDWLKYLVNAIEKDKNLAAVNSKALLYYPFVKVTIDSEVNLRSDFTDTIDFKQVGVAIEEVFTKNPFLQRMIQYYQGFYKRENDKHEDQIPLRWTNGKGELLLAVDPKQKEVIYTITLRAQRPKSSIKTKVSIKADSTVLNEITLNGEDVKQIKVRLDTEALKKHFQYEVQNAGNVVFRSGHSRDRGAVVSKNQQYYEIDNDYFEEPAEVNAFCGVSVIIRKDLYDKHGGFDESFFMYYEDVDLSLKFRRLGYKLGFEPKSKLYHIHAGSSIEWSTFFIYHVEKNHLALTVKHFPWIVVFQEVLLYFGMIFITVIKMIRWRLTEYWQVFEEKKELLEVRSKAIKWFFAQLPKLIASREALKSAEKVTLEDLFETYY